MNFLIDLLIGVVIIAVCYLILIVIIQLPELANKIGIVFFIIMCINIIAGIIGGIILLFSIIS